MNTPYAKLPPADIAANVTLREAAAVTTPRAGDAPKRIADAYHEAHHVVVDACFGCRTGYVVIPIRDIHGAILVPKHWPPDRPLQDHATSWGATHQREDFGTQLEDAVGYYAGILAECVLWGDKLPILHDEAKSDHAQGLDAIEKFVRHSSNRTGTQREALTEKLVGRHHRNTLRTAKALVGLHYATIDATAAVILCHSKNGGLLWTDEHQEWLTNEIHKKNEGHSHKRRKTYIKRPPWLASAAKKRIGV